jgi:urease accessory protein
MLASMNFMPARRIEIPSPQRAKGRLDLAFRHDAAASQTRIERFYQAGCLKARLPRPAGRMCDVITMNISGGIAGGDQLHTEIELGVAAECCVTSQAAERVYRALDESAAKVSSRLTLGAGARLDYLPQETILFEGFALERTLDIEIAKDARFLGVESVVFGRQAMGETVQYGKLRDRITLRQGGKLLLHDVNRLEGEIAARLTRKAVAGGNIAMASLIYGGPDIEVLLPCMRAAMAAQKCEAGASAFDGIIFGRILAPSAADLRRCVVAVLNACRDGRALPRSWQS